MSTSKTLHPDLQRFPAGTSVGAYRENAWSNARQVGAPTGSADSTVAVAADGSLTLTSLQEATAYVGYALVSGEDRIFRFRSPAASCDPDALLVGESSMPRAHATNTTLAMTSQLLRMMFFTAQKTEFSTQVRIPSGSVAAGATPTLVRAGVYEVNSDNSVTLIASTPNDTALLAATFTNYTKALSAGYTKTKGKRYALALLVVTAATVPQIGGNPVMGASQEAAVAPRLVSSTSAQADLPASLTAAQLGNSGGAPYLVVLP